MNLRRLLPLTIVCALGSALVWLLWVQPVANSLDSADTSPVSIPVQITLEHNERVGIWSDSVAADLETLECTVTDATGASVPLITPPALEWSDVLWWASSRPGFSQIAGFSADAPGEHTVHCMERTGWYDGDVLLAADSFGDRAIGLGRMGSVDFAQGTILAYLAAVLPLLTIALAVMTLVAAVRGRIRAVPRDAP